MIRRLARREQIYVVEVQGHKLDSLNCYEFENPQSVRQLLSKTFDLAHTYVSPHDILFDRVKGQVWWNGGCAQIGQWILSDNGESKVYNSLEEVKKSFDVVGTE